MHSLILLFAVCQKGRGSSVFCSQSLSLIRAYSLTEQRICPTVRYLPLAEIHFWAALKGASQDVRQDSQTRRVIGRTPASSVFFQSLLPLQGLSPIRMPDSVIHWVNNYLLTAYCGLGFVLGSRDSSVNLPWTWRQTIGMCSSVSQGRWRWALWFKIRMRSDLGQQGFGLRRALVTVIRKPPELRWH